MKHSFISSLYQHKLYILYISNNFFFFLTGKAGVQLPHLTAASTPQDLFDEFFTPDLVRKVVEETNRYATQNRPTTSRKMKEWIPVDEEEIRKYLGLRILMGWAVLPSYSDYWSSDGLARVPDIGKVMSRDRFNAIRSHIHFNNNDDPMAKNDRLWKIRPVLDGLLDRFRTVYRPDQWVCIDESLLRYRGRHMCVQFIPSKRSRYGLKVYKLCESCGPACGYTSAMKVYMGDDRQGDGTPASFGVVMHLLKEAGLFDKGYIVCTDNWYSSPMLFHHLQSRKTGAIGTVRPNRKCMPRLEVKQKGEVDFKSSNTGMLALAWKDRKQVTLLSTFHRDATTTDVPGKKPGSEAKAKPNVVLDYNKGKVGVDVSDQMAVSYGIRRKCVKWYQTLFAHLLDTTLVNAWLVHRALGGGLSHLDFRKQLTRSLCGLEDLPRHRTSSTTSPSPSPTPAHVLTSCDKYRRCKGCSSLGKRKVTKFECRLCNAGFCPGDCFNSWTSHKE